jgi:phytoene synthase
MTEALSPILTAKTPEEVLASVKNSGSSFLLGMMALPEKRRLGMFGLYAFCRAVDDIADEDDDRARRQRNLEIWRSYVSDLFKGKASHPVMQLLQQPLLDYALREKDFYAIIDGMEMDARGPIQRPSWEQLDLYCDRVASAVGRLSVLIFGEPSPEGQEVAHHLGRALQLTNILRDLDEDATRQRLYLPREALEEAGITSDKIDEVLMHPAIDHACRGVARKAVFHFDEAAALMDKCTRKAMKPARLMRDYYAAILREMLLMGWAYPRFRVSLGPIAKIRLLLKAYFS